MDNQETVAFRISDDADAGTLRYPKLFTLDEFKVKYGEDNCTVMLQDRERQLYGQKARTLATELASDGDWMQNVQIALDAWKPCDDRPPTEIEEIAQRLLAMPPQAQGQLYRILERAAAKDKEEKARQEGEDAAQQSQALEDKFQAPADVGEPLTAPQQEPAVTSFEVSGAEQDQQAASNAKAVEVAGEGHASDIEANAEDYAAPTAFDEGGTEGVIAVDPRWRDVYTDTPITEEGQASSEVGMPPQPTEGRVD